jgi:hypothetical protein
MNLTMACVFRRNLIVINHAAMTSWFATEVDWVSMANLFFTPGYFESCQLQGGPDFKRGHPYCLSMMKNINTLSEASYLLSEGIP